MHLPCIEEVPECNFKHGMLIGVVSSFSTMYLLLHDFTWCAVTLLWRSCKVEFCIGFCAETVAAAAATTIPCNWPYHTIGTESKNANALSDNSAKGSFVNIFPVLCVPFG